MENKNQGNQAEFFYELLPNYTIKHKQWCNSISFNFNSKLLLVAYGKSIKVFQFKNGELKLIQILISSLHTISTLNFFNMDKCSLFISGSCDSKLTLRYITQLRNLKQIQRLNQHSRAICCVSIGKNQEMFLSGSVDQTIKLWSCFQQDHVSCQWSCQQTITDHTNDVYILDINQKQTKAISCGYDDTILIMEIVQQLKNYYLILKQKIKVKNFGYRILFINDDDFIFQSYCSNQLKLFQLDQNQQYFITKQLQVLCKTQNCNIFFAPQFISSKNYFVCKNGSDLNFIRFNPKNNELELLYSITFDNQEQYGYLSQNGEFLVTWDQKQENIFIRQYKKKFS